MRVASIRLLCLCLGLAALVPSLAPDSALAQSRDRHDRRMVIVNESAAYHPRVLRHQQRRQLVGAGPAGDRA